jgi:ankyrin repeat protein
MFQGHESVVQALIDAGADVNKQDQNQWSPLMWAMTNRHKGIAKILLDNNASSDQKTSSGRTAFDFVPPDSEISTTLDFPKTVLKKKWPRTRCGED